MTKARSVLVTGASTGIGEACARHLDQLGWRVFAGVRREVDGDRLRQGSSDRLTPVQLDVTDEEQVNTVLKVIGEAVGADGLDGLVNNAGISFGGPVEIIPLDHWRQQFEVNVVGQVAVTKAALPLIRLATGRVVFVSSISGRVAPAYMGPYAASKYALEAVGMTLRKEVSPWGIRVAVVEPGVIDTPIWDKSPDVADFERTVGTEGFQLYAPFLMGMGNHLERIKQHAAPASEVATVIEHALTAPHPRHRYLVGRDAKVTGTLAQYLPDRVFTRYQKFMARRLRS